MRLNDSELIQYASLSDDPEKRRLADLASWADRWDKVLGDMLDIDDPEALAVVLDQHSEYYTALTNLDTLDGTRLDTDYLQYLARLSKAVNDGRVQLVEDCPNCDGDGFAELYTLNRCTLCDGRGVTFTPADSDSI